MNVLFVHNNFPAQFRHVVRSLMQSGGHQIAAICGMGAVVPPGVLVEYYDSRVSSNAHVFARRFDTECFRAERVLYAAMRLKLAGFIPDIIVAHSGWGETLPLREAFTKARIIVYCEFYYRSDGQDVGFDPEFPDFGMDGRVGLNIKNASQLLALVDADIGISPTYWQRSTYPALLQEKIVVAHEGVDTAILAPARSQRQFRIHSDLVLDNQSEVITYVARNLEPLRGIHSFLRALPQLLRCRPNAHIVIVGGDGVSYGAPPDPPYRTWREKFWPEISNDVDASRIHFVGQLAYPAYVNLLQISSVHCYLTYPFVLSWSMMEAMSVGCAIVASDTAPVNEVLRDGSGHLVSFFDPNSLAQTAAELLADRIALEQSQSRARARIIEKYDMSRICTPAFLSILQSI